MSCVDNSHGYGTRKEMSHHATVQGRSHDSPVSGPRGDDKKNTVIGDKVPLILEKLQSK